ncbi:MAG: hydrogenase maturation nickel metallochaperone HypA [Dactylosporangium sp.]|nr:hydrogenase maturation nickel metallochaperone HypA [Dactylosporangium sp.]NNJ59478.1 hydrogenase maturation nickel metallochaperone HypA [Dactylosporangium sp.]
MHELSICASMADIVRRHADGRRVLSVQVRVGQLRQVVPEALSFCWTAVNQQTPLMDTTLDIEYIPGEIECGACQGRQVLADPFLCCPSCGSTDVSVVAGEEFLITSIDLADPGEATEG